MFWGIETGDGWYDIIDALCEALESVYTTGVGVGDEFVEIKPQVIADQIKEKYGTLRFYYHIEFDEAIRQLGETNPVVKQRTSEYRWYIDGIVHMAEVLSARTCEDTGQHGELHVSGGSRLGWYRTLNREYSQTNPKIAARNYVPVADLPVDTPETKSLGSSES